MSGQGFASASPAARKAHGRKGGKSAAAKGTLKVWKGTEAKKASMKGVATRKKIAALMARQRLNSRFSTLDLDALHLTEEELIRYGGTAANYTTRQELRERIANLLTAND